MKSAITFKARVWVYPGGTGAWHFITVPKKEAERIKKQFGMHARGWGSLPVKASIEKTEWQTSIFPDSKSGTYLLPLKAAVRRQEGLFEGDTAQVTLTVRP